MVACDAWTAKESVTVMYTLEEGITIYVQSLQRSKGSIAKWI